MAAVIYNRLHNRMPLGIDATIRYGRDVPAPSRSSSRTSRATTPTTRGTGSACRRRRSRTRVSPRCAPRRSPAQVDYLYFVRKPDGVHHFFTASESEFCQKSLEYGYGGC